MMAVLAELCCLDCFPSHLGPLDVLLSASRFPSFFPDDTDSPTVFFRPQQPRGFAIPAILLRVHPTSEDGTAAKSRSRVCLYTSRLFVRFHRLGGLGTIGTVRAAEPVKLARVVLGARSRQSLRSATAGHFTSRLDDLCCRRQPLLARQGEPLLLPGEEPEQAELLVLDCSPVMQGQITASTAVVLTDGARLMEPVAPPLPCRPLRLCVSDFAHSADGLGGGGCLLDSPRLLSSGLCGLLQALEGRVEVKVLDAQRHLGVDVDSHVFVSRQLLLQLGLFNHEWVRLWRSGGSTHRLVSVLVLDQIQSPEAQKAQEDAFISPTLWFNMTQGEPVPERSCTLKMKRLAPPPAVVGSLPSESVCRSFSPPFASELHLQPVMLPRHQGLSCYNNLLSEHFSTPRLVSQGDILTVAAADHPDLLEAAPEGIHTCPALFFRVQAVCSLMQEEEVEGGGAFLVDKLHTALYLGAPNSSTVPYGSGDGGSLWTSWSFPGLEPTINLLSSIITPHLPHSSSLLPGCTVLLCGPAGGGKVTVVKVVSRRLNLHLLKVDCLSLLGNTAAASEAKLASAFQRAGDTQPCILLLRNLHFLLRPAGGGEEDGRLTGALLRLLAGTSSRVVVVGTSSSPTRLSAGLVAAFIHQVVLESPTEEQRLAMLEALSQQLHLAVDVNLETLSKLTTGLVLGDLAALLVAAGRSACRRLRHTSGLQQEELCSSGITILKQDFSVAMETLQDVQASTIGAPKIPDVRWEDVGGLHQVKQEILDTVQLPLQHPDLLLGLRRTGLLMFGPPGGGKTLLAKAVATESSMTFLSVKGPELLNMYVGQSEENIREVFSRARSAAPCIIFFDELDSLAPSRGRTGDSGGVMDRVVSQLLAELDSLSSSVGVFVIGATNRPDLLDQSLLRPGRLDKLVFVGLSEDPEAQLQVLQAILRKFQLDSSVNLQRVVEHCPAHMSGADMYALCSDAMMAAIKRRTVSMETGVDSEDSPLRLHDDDFTAALETLRPSVSAEELVRYRRLQQHLEGRSRGDTPVGRYEDHT